MHSPSPRSAKVITIINLKGGVGKTHTVWLLSSVCQERSLRLLAVDTDPQGNLTNSFLPERDGKPGIEALFNPASDAQALTLIRRTRFSHIDIIPASQTLARFDYTDPKQWKHTDLHLVTRKRDGRGKGTEKLNTPPKDRQADSSLNCIVSSVPFSALLHRTTPGLASDT